MNQKKEQVQTEQAEQAEQGRASAWNAYCNSGQPQRWYIDHMACVDCGKDQLVAHLNDSGRCWDCCR